MGQKVNPIGFRLGVNRDWRSRWYASPQELPEFLHSDLEIRNYVKKKLQYAAVSKIVIERAWNSIRVTIFTARPGIVIGRKGAEIEKMTEEISKMAQGKQVKIDIQEIKTPELDAQLVAENVALQIERRIAYRRAMKKAVQTAMDFGAEGIRLRCSGRLNGAEISRSEWYREGKVPLHTLRTAVDYGFAEANTVYGKIGVKCWMCKKEEPAGAACFSASTAAGSGTRAGSSLRRNFMPLMPKRVKYRKSQRGSRKGTASRNLRIDFGEFGLQTLERAWITNTQLEAARVALTRNMKRKGKLWIRIFPDKSVTSRPPETRMGKGKGQPEHWVATVRPGNILFELDGVPESVARESLRLAADKLPVRTKFLTRHHVRAA